MCSQTEAERLDYIKVFLLTGIFREIPSTYERKQCALPSFLLGWKFTKNNNRPQKPFACISFQNLPLIVV